MGIGELKNECVTFQGEIKYSSAVAGRFIELKDSFRSSLGLAVDSFYQFY